MNRLQKKLGLTGTLVAVTLLTACATTPKEPEVVVQEEVVAVIEVPEARPVERVEPVAPVIVEQPPIADNFVPNLPTPGSMEDFVYQSGGDARVYFSFNQSDLTLEAISALRNQAEWLKQYPNVTAIIEGNADERGTREFNLALGGRRANTVKDFLVNQGVNPQRLTAISFGKERPIDGRSDESGWARNRNAHTNISINTISF